MPHELIKQHALECLYVNSYWLEKDKEMCDMWLTRLAQLRKEEREQLQNNSR